MGDVAVAASEETELSHPVAMPLIVAAVGAVVFAVFRPLASDFDGGWIEVLEWAALGAVVWGGGAALLERLVVQRTLAGRLKTALVAAGVIGISWFMFVNPTDVDRLASTIRVVVMAVAIIGGLWIGLNLLFNLARRDWTVFLAVSGALIAVVAFAVLRGNRSITPLVADADARALGTGGGFLGHVEWPVFGALVWGVGLYLMRKLPSRPVRAAVGIGLGVLTGLLIGQNLQVWHRPEINWVELIVVTAIGAAIGAGIAYRSGKIVPAALLGAAIGWTIDAWLLADWHVTVTDTARNNAVIAAVVPLALLGARLGLGSAPTPSELARFDTRSRAFVFLGPALAFLSAALVIPAIRTIYLSLLDRRSEEFVGFDNYRTLWNDQDSFDFSNWTDMFGSQLFWLAVALVVTGTVVGLVAGQRRNGEPSYEPTGASVASLILSGLLLAFAAFSVIRGTFFNNVWWVITVTTLSTTLGLTIAVLSERAGRFENAAKSLIFMPMAVSFVGASIVWRLQYQPRDPRNEQTGVLNAIWVALGKLSRAGEDGNTYPAAARYLVLAILAAILVPLVWRAVRRAIAGETFSAYTAGIVVFGYLFVELARRSLGGFRVNAAGQVVPDTVLFLQEPPFNNVFLMIILIWIQTGFAMVILSAAIKAVPQEFIEAARVDGASESQTFFQVILPQILPTVGVVVTTLIVLVTKVFDIVKVTTGGNFGTNVLANDMFSVSFNFFNTGLGSAIAVFILLSVLPVMFLNVRRMQQTRAES